MNDFNSQFNEAFRLGLEGGTEGIEKVAATTNSYIKKKIRQESFSRKIQPMEKVGKGEVQRDESGDGFYKLVDIEPDSRAVVLNLRAQPNARYVTGERARVNFLAISTERFEKNESELLAYEMPITKILQKNNILDIQHQEDMRFYKLMRAAVADSGLSHNASIGSDPFQRVDLIAGKRLHAGVKLKSTSVLMTEVRYLDVETWDATAVGDSIVTDIVKTGYEHPQLSKMNLQVTNKSDIKLATESSSEFDDEIWFFTAPEFMGKSYILEDTKFYIDKRGRLIMWESWEDIAQAIINVNAVSRVKITA